MSLLFAAGYFLLAVAVHAVWCRLPPRFATVPKFVGVGAVLGLILAAQLYAAEGLSSGFFGGVLSYALACELYIFLFTLIMSSVSAIWLRRLSRGSAEQSALAEFYSAAQMVDVRVQRLVDNGFLTPDGESYRLTEKARRLIASFDRLRRFFGHDTVRRDTGLPDAADPS